eukprot:jgi/Chlat1/6424/Chrsp45S00463
MAAAAAGALLGLGNPLLDITAVVAEGSDLLERYGLRPGQALRAEERHLPLYKELCGGGGGDDHHHVTYTAGGSTQNSMRVAQVEYLEVDDEATGHCAVLVCDAERTLVTNLCAAHSYSTSHVLQPEVWAHLERARVIYSASFFLTCAFETIMLVAKHCLETSKPYAANLSATFIMRNPDYLARLLEVLPYVDYLFGNDEEALAFAESQGWPHSEDDVESTALRLSAWRKASGTRSRTVVITRGPKSSVVAVNSRVLLYPVVPVADNELVDTNGAGDAFVGGFLSQVMLWKDVAACMRAGHYAANVVVRRSGCTFPEHPNLLWT